MPTDGVLKSVYLGAELLEEILSLREWKKFLSRLPYFARVAQVS